MKDALNLNVCWKHKERKSEWLKKQRKRSKEQRSTWECASLSTFCNCVNELRCLFLGAVTFLCLPWLPDCQLLCLVLVTLIEQLEILKEVWEELLLQRMAPQRHPYLCHPLSQLPSGWCHASSAVPPALALSAGKPYLQHSNQYANPGPFILCLVYRQSYSIKIKTITKGKINRGLTVTFASLLTAYDEQGTSTPHLLNQLLSHTYNFQTDW